MNVPESVLKVTKSWTAANPTHIEAVDSTTKAVYNAGTRELTATVTAADKGTLAGSVKFSAGDWSKTVKLDAEGKATVTLPASVSGHCLRLLTTATPMVWVKSIRYYG